MGIWRTVSVYDAVDYDVAADLGTELLAGVISLLTVIGMRTASRTLAKLRRSEDRLRAVVDSAMDAIVVVDEPDTSATPTPRSSTSSAARRLRSSGNPSPCSHRIRRPHSIGRRPAPASGGACASG